MPRPLNFRSTLLDRGLMYPLALAVALGLSFAAWFSLVLSPLKKEYLASYLVTVLDGPRDQIPPVSWVWKTAPKREPAIALSADVVATRDAGPQGLLVTLSPQARAQGWTGVMRAKAVVGAANEKTILREQFFDGQGVGRLLVTPLCGTALLLLLSLALVHVLGGRSKKEDRHGRRTKGPELVSALASRLRERSGGIRLRLASKLGPLAPSFVIPQKLLASHILLMGDTGSGKSNAIRQILRQVQDRGETAIVYDPAGEFVQEFYKPERGDLILNPLDTRCPFWTLQGELDGRGVEDAIAAAMIPEKQGENGFFTDAPRRVLASLLRKGGSVATLLEWMANPAEIEKRLEGTPQAAYLDKTAGPQRAGVLASLNMIADSLHLLPKKEEAKEWFSTGKWRFERTRWVFLTSRPALRERILPLHSAWLDLFILRMMAPGVNPAEPVWFVLDALASLNKLPQLHTAVTESRKYGNPVVLGFQGRSQLEKRYGQDAETMLSQPATKIFFKTSEPKAAKWISETLGEIEVERKESRTPKLLSSQKSFAMEIATKPLIMASEIAGLEPLRGFVKQENKVVPVKFAYVAMRNLQPAFTERKAPIPEPRPSDNFQSAAAPDKPVLASANQPSAMTIPVIMSTPPLSTSREFVLPESTPLDPRRSAFKKKPAIPREWKPLD